MKKVCVCFAHVITLHISPSPVMFHPSSSAPSLLFLTVNLTGLRYLTSHRMFQAQNREESALRHRWRGVWLPGQVLPPHRLWAQAVRQDDHCRWWRDAHQRSRPRQYLWLDKTHTRQHWMVRCSYSVRHLCFADFSRWRKQRKPDSGNRGQAEDAGRQTVLWLVLERHCIEIVDETVWGVMLTRLKENSILVNGISENTSSEELNKLFMVKIQFGESFFSTEYNMEIQNSERRIPAYALLESQRELGSLGQQFLMANHWADQAQREGIHLCSEL